MFSTPMRNYKSMNGYKLASYAVGVIFIRQEDRYQTETLCLFHQWQ
jgi:hypothetical protein